MARTVSWTTSLASVQWLIFIFANNTIVAPVRGQALHAMNRLKAHSCQKAAPSVTAVIEKAITRIFPG
jgi:hypothetical protein